MADNELPYFKFVTALIDRGIWAVMSPAARALYPVLLRFSDRHFKPVYPGTQKLLSLTGFKQKGSLRKARKELVDLGLISLTEGSGRKNTCYHFRFDWGATETPPTGATQSPSRGRMADPVTDDPVSLRGLRDSPPYNQIHININNHVPETPEDLQSNQDLEFLKNRFGAKAVELAKSECKLADIPDSIENLKEILYARLPKEKSNWEELQKYLSEKISPGSLALIQSSFVEEQDGYLVFQEPVPEYLKSMIRKLYSNSFFQPGGKRETVTSRPDFWKNMGVDL